MGELAFLPDQLFYSLFPPVSTLDYREVRTGKPNLICCRRLWLQAYEQGRREKIGRILKLRTSKGSMRTPLMPTYTAGIRWPSSCLERTTFLMGLRTGKNDD